MLTLLTGCSTNVEGSAVKGDAGPAPAAVDPSKLDTGRYPTEPNAPLGLAGDRGVLVEAQRMANNVVGPWEVDSTLTRSFGMGALALTNPAAMTLIGPPEYAGVVGEHDFVNGFVTARTAEGRKILLNVVLRFADTASAAAAKAELGDVAKRSSEGAQPVTIPGHDDTAAVSYPMADGPAGKQWTAVRAFTAHNEYVFMQLAQASDGVDPAVGLVAKTVELQSPAIDQFRATDIAEFADISIDPTGLLERTLLVPEEQATVVQNATYERRGALHFQSDPSRSATLFEQTQTDLVAMAKTNVYETKDADAAGRIVSGFFDELQPTAKEATAVRDLPGSRCLQLEDKSFYCLAAADRYAIESSGTNLLEAQQQAAAQYVLLTRS